MWEEEKTEKVFCSYCLYFYNKRIERCVYRNNQKEHTNWRNKYTTSIKHPKHINKNNNCQWFKLSPERR